ncbi:MAG: hypothetical protein ACFB50_17305 [Rubrobacteraceae bacterium]
MEILPSGSSPASAGALAAGLLSDACRLDLEPRDSLQLEVVRDLAEDLKDQFETLAARTATEEDEPAGLLVESALRCADLANLAACNLPELSEAAAPRAAASVHLAAGAVQALCLLADGAAEALDATLSDNARRDAQGARWRADLALHQVNEFARNPSRI